MRIKPFISRTGDLPDIVDALVDGTTLKMRYRDRFGRMTVREVEPYKIEKKRGKDTLWAYDLLRKDNHIRQFHIDNILKAKKTENEYRPRWDVEVDPSFEKYLKKAPKEEGVDEDIEEEEESEEE